ncbi:arylsulfatase [Rhodophyticola sp. CCM32]|uniref:arylsulfatase n=1 Tax=Rhodophyticola sp. CCM32 TaxID=2916397 RepID=UPI001AEFA499|nr:arylsulfatase [Rhodophyticola sp. CCM32]
MSFDMPKRPTPGSPNIVYVILDDVGYADLGCYGSEIRTPHFDRLAETGVRYSNFHTTTMCSPTRASLLTGRNHHSVGMRFLANFDFGYPSGRGCITHRAATVAEMLGGEGYSTFAVGKWHLAQVEETSAAGPFDQWPLGRGFQRFYGFMNGSTDQYHPELIEDNHPVDPPDLPENGYHLTADMIDQAITMIGAQSSMTPEVPFFLNLAFSAGHFPHQVGAEWMARYDGVYDVGWDVIREQRLARQKDMGLVPEDTRLPPNNPQVDRWDDLDPDTRKVAVRMQQAYAGFLDYTDAQFGRLVAYLDRLGRLDNTLFVLISDNGASNDCGPVGTTNVIRRFNQIPDSTKANLEGYDDIGGPRYFGNYPWGWAQASNTPLRLYKSYTHGGGVRDPLIVSWPDGIAARGQICHQFHHVVDVTPTVLELCGVTAPETHKGIPQMPVHGTSFAYTFTAPEDESRKETQYFEMFGHRGIWHKGWKAVTNHTKGEDFEADDWELYNLTEDFNETRNLARDEPAKLAELRERWWAEAGRYDVMPLDDREVRFRPVSKPGGISGRGHFVFYPEVKMVPNATAPRTGDRSHRISADVILQPGNTGTLVSNGNCGGGYALFLKDDCLTYVYNACGVQVHLTSDPLDLTGAARLTFAFERTGKLQGKGTLLLDDRELVSRDFTQMLLRPTLGPVFIGRGGLPPVSDRLTGASPFNGILKRVEFEIDNDSPTKPPNPHVD